MKLFNSHARQTFHFDDTDPVTGVVTKYVFPPLRAKDNVDDRVGRYLLKNWPKHFTADEEAMDLRAESKKQLAERDQVIADLTKRCLEAEARADKAQAALEAFADEAEKGAFSKDPLGVTGLAEVAKSAETAEPAAPAAEATKRRKSPPKAAMPVTEKP